jgi:phenylalanine-4-hydroxylase
MNSHITLRSFTKFLPSFENTDLVALAFTISNDKPGALQQALSCFLENNLNLTHISSKPASLLDSKQGYSFTVDISSPDCNSLSRVISQLKGLGMQATLLGGDEVPWFPRKLSDLDLLDQRTLGAGAELESDHPGFKDAEYRKRRHDIAQIAFDYQVSNQEIPTVDYTDKEKETWSIVYDKLHPLHKKYACHEFLESMNDFEKYCGLREDNIPQLRDISNYLKEKTGFRLKPVSGLLSSRDFLNALALRVFNSTQYIRHHSVPFYTPEPDIVHELLGHAPLFANPAFADFSQEIGLASLGASDEEVKKLATCYWYSVEFGLCTDNNQRKAYGAGVLSSVDELLNSMSDKAEFRYFDPFKACDIPYPITKLQPIYWISHSFAEAKEQMERFSSKMKKVFHVTYDKEENCVRVDHKIKGVLSKDYNHS